MPHKKSNPQKGMPQNKILTLINSSDGGIGGQYGVTFEREKALTGKQAPRYRQASRKMKTKILDEFVAAAGYSRKYALHLLTHWG
ncbi:MAG: hypothetical protein LBE17_01905, partial [Treponema sp.]|nr:hypothetical protein [Treponema sp.]